MNFALMFALALGIDYALFIVDALPRRAVRLGAAPRATRSRRRWTPPARRCCSRGSTVLISLSAVMLVPSPAFRSMALGIMLSVVFVLAATLTLLPAVLGRSGPRVDNAARCRGRTPASTARRASPRGASGSGARPLAAGVAGARRAARPRRSRCWASRPACRRSRSSRRATRSRSGYELVQHAFGPGAPGALQIVAPAARRPPRAARSPRRPGHRPGPPAAAEAPAAARADPGRPDRRPVRPAVGRHDRPAPRRAPGGRARRRRRGREPRPRERARRPARRS